MRGASDSVFADVVCVSGAAYTGGGLGVLAAGYVQGVFLLARGPFYAISIGVGPILLCFHWHFAHSMLFLLAFGPFYFVSVGVWPILFCSYWRFGPFYSVSIGIWSNLFCFFLRFGPFSFNSMWLFFIRLCSV